jgi:DNA-binding transcriptional LysR family regulator
MAGSLGETEAVCVVALVTAQTTDCCHDNNSDMDLNDVRVLVSVVDSGSFSEAARRLDLPKSSVSRRVARLERALGARLLQRTTRHLHLTDAGQLYYRHCVRVLHELDQAASTINELQGAPRGTLRLSAPNDLDGIVSSLVYKYQALYPDVRVLLDLTTRYVDVVSEGFDLVLRAGVLSDSSLVARRLMRFTFQLFASETYVQRKGMPTTPDELRNHDCLCVGTLRAGATWELHGPGRVERVDVTGPIASNDLSFLRQAVVDGRGIGRLPVRLGDRLDIGRPGLVRILPDYRGTESGLYAVYPSAERLAPKIRRFVELAVRWSAEPILQPWTVSPSG